MGETTAAAWWGLPLTRTWSRGLHAAIAFARPAVTAARARWGRFAGMRHAAWRAFARAQALRLVEPVTIAPGAGLLAAPLAFGLGAAAYLGLETEPAAWPSWLVAAAAAAAFILARRGGRAWAARAAALIGMCALGFALADLRVDARDAPRVAERSAPYEVEGWVERIDASTPARRRYTIRVSRLDGRDSGLPRRVRVGAAAGAAHLGDAVRVRAVLSPPDGPPTPGAYDFARAAHFAQLGGVGYAVGAMTPAPGLAIRGSAAHGRWITTVRGRLSEQLRAAGGPGAGGILSALVTGDRGDIDADTTDQLYVSGLGHILSISGMHLALVGGGAFFILAWLLAAIEPLARRVNVRKIAAVGALALSLGYLILSGWEAPAVRSLVMAGIALGGIVVDRRALTQRGVAIAALALLLVAPENAVSPGFQMSFASVIALVAANDFVRSRSRGDPKEPGFVGAARRFLFGLTMTSIVAGSATAPFAAYHFNRITLLGTLANVIAMPVFEMIAMPSAIVAGLLAPLGLEAGPAWVAARAIDIVVGVGAWAASSPMAQSPTPAAPPIALALAASALVAWAALARGRWRVAIPLALAAALAWRAAPESDLWLGESGGWLARVAGPHGAEWVGELGRGEDYGAEMFQQRLGGEGAAILAPAQSPAFACDREGCVGRIDGRLVAVAESWSGVIADCARADVVLTPGPAPARVRARCEGVVLAARRGRSDGGGVIDLGATEPALRIAGGGSRPWRSRAPRA